MLPDKRLQPRAGSLSWPLADPGLGEGAGAVADSPERAGGLGDTEVWRDSARSGPRQVDRIHGDRSTSASAATSASRGVPRLDAWTPLSGPASPSVASRATGDDGGFPLTQS